MFVLASYIYHIFLVTEVLVHPVYTGCVQQPVSAFYLENYTILVVREKKKK